MSKVYMYPFAFCLRVAPVYRVGCFAFIHGPSLFDDSTPILPPHHHRHRLPPHMYEHCVTDVALCAHPAELLSRDTVLSHDVS